MQFTTMAGTTARPRAGEAQAAAARVPASFQGSPAARGAAKTDGGVSAGVRVTARTVAVGAARPAQASQAAARSQPQVQIDENNPVVAFLRDAGLQMYARALLSSGFDDMETLVEIEDADMKDLGIHSYHAVRLRRRLQELQRQEPAEQALDESNPVVAFLCDAGLQQYARVLLRNGFDEMETLVLIDDPDLKELGVPRGHAVKLRRRLREYELAAAAHEEEVYSTRAAPAGRAAARRPPTAQQAPATTWKGARQPQVSVLANRSVPTEQMRSAVERSWEQVQLVGTFAVGELLYRYTFQLAPEAIGLFPAEVRRKYREWSADEGHEQEEDMDIWESPALRKLFGKVINAVGCTVAGLHDMGKLVPMLTKLGMRHINYGVSDEHWTVLGKALDLTLRDLLGADYTQEVENAWTMVYGFMSSIMIEGLHLAQDMAKGGNRLQDGDDATSQYSGGRSATGDAAVAVSETGVEKTGEAQEDGRERQISEASTQLTQLEERGGSIFGSGMMA